MAVWNCHNSIYSQFYKSQDVNWNQGIWKVNRKAIILPGVLILSVIALVGGFITIKQHSDRIAQKNVIATEPPEEAPIHVKKRRRGSKVKKKVDITSTFSAWGVAGQDNKKELHEQTPEEAVESLSQGLDTYRALSDEDKSKVKIALEFVNLIINTIGDNAMMIVADWDEQKRTETIKHAQISIENIDAMESVVAPNMTAEEYEVIGGTLLALKNFNVNLLNVLQ